MVKTSAACPKCHQPITVELQRLFDLNTDPQAKQKLLSGTANMVNCPHCGYHGPLPTPIVYHDPDHELLLTFFPPEAGVPVNQQEMTIGPLIKKVVDDLVPEKRKAYIFRPQTMLTQQRLFERILETDGITPEMIKAQQDRLNLIQRLAMASSEALPVAITQEDDLVDDQLFMLLSHLIEASASGGDENSARQLAGLQQALLEHSTFGKKVAEQTRDTQKAISDLQALSKKGLTRENLLDLVINASTSEVQLATIVSMARGGMDYAFFQLLSDKLEKSKGDDQAKLIALREKLLDMTHEVDEAIKAQTEQAQKLLDEILSAEKTEEAAQAALPKITQIFVDLLRQELKKAQSANDQGRFAKLQTVAQIIQAASTSGAYIELIEALLQAPDEASLNALLEEAKDAIDDEFLQFLSGLTNQVESQGDQAEMVDQLKRVHKAVLRFSMQKNISQAG